jgi:nucleoporin NDC1
VEIGITSLSKAGISIAGGFAIYYAFLRQFLWDLFFSWFRYPFTLRQYHKSTGIVPTLDIVCRILYATALLTFLWDFSNAAFSAYIAQEPLKKDQPITAESKDPNGSLIRGLDHRLKTAKSFAFWELWIITTKFPERRKTIFADIDREPSTWTQVSTLCLREIRGVSDRISAFNDAQAPKPTPEDAANGSAEATLQKQAAVPPLKTDDIVAQTPPAKSRVEKVGRLAGSFAKQHGLSPSSPPRPIQGATKAIAFAERKLLTEPQRQEIADTPKNVRQAAGGALMAFLKNRVVGWPFRQSFARRAVAVICGAPSARTGIIVFAAGSLAKLCTESLREDPYGAVAKDVKSIIGVYADAIRDVERFLRDAKPHWTDVYFTEPQRGRVEEVNTVVDALRVDLQDILGAFGEYASSLGISEKELAEAKMLAGGREMTEKT